MEMKVTVDRVEDGVVVCIDDDVEQYEFYVEEFPAEAHAGDVFELTLDGERAVEAVLLEAETEALRLRAQAAMERLRKKFKKQ